MIEAIIATAYFAMWFITALILWDQMQREYRPMDVQTPGWDVFLCIVAGAGWPCIWVARLYNSRRDRP